MRRSRNPTGTDHLRIPRESAQTYTRLTCLLLNALQSPPVVPNQKLLPPRLTSSETTGEYISYHKFSKNDREVREVGLRDLPHIKDARVGIKFEQQTQRGHQSFFLTAKAWITHDNEDPGRYYEDYRMHLIFRWDVEFGERNTLERIRFSESIEWERILELLKRCGKVSFDMYGEGRMLPAEIANAGLPLPFPEMLDVIFE